MKVSNKPNPIRKKQKRTRRRNRPAQVGLAYATGSSAKMTSIVVEKTERLGTIVSPATASGVVLTQYVNAGNLALSTSSYLGRQAALFDKYQFSKFEIEYVPIVSASTSGNVIIGMDLSPDDAAPGDASGMTNLSLGYAEGNAWRNFKYAAQCFACFPAGPKFVRSTTEQLGTNASLFDMGSLYIFTEGAPVNTTLGYIDVHYKVHLHGVNRNANDSPAGLLRPAALATLSPTSTSAIVPGGTYATTTFASFRGFSPSGIGQSDMVFSAVTPAEVYGTVGNYITYGTNSITLNAGTYSVKLTSCVCSDTYSNGLVRLKRDGNVLLSNAHGWGSLSLPTTAYVQTGSVDSIERSFTVTTTSTLTLDTFVFYSATPYTQNKTWNVVYVNGDSVPSTFITLTRLAA